jgi:hypothetical protein
MSQYSMKPTKFVTGLCLGLKTCLVRGSRRIDGTNNFFLGVLFLVCQVASGLLIMSDFVNGMHKFVMWSALWH